MRTTVAGLGLILWVGLALAQERVPQDRAQKFARLFAEHAAKVNDPQLKTDVDAEKPFALQKEERAAMVLPDKKLSAEALSKATKEIIPVGQLWFRNVAPASAGKVVARDKLRIITITVDNQDHPLPLCLLGVRAKENKELELVVFGKDKEPLLLLPLQKTEVTQELPIEFEAKKGDDENTGVLTLTLLGKYQTKLLVMAPE